MTQQGGRPLERALRGAVDEHAFGLDTRERARVNVDVNEEEECCRNTMVDEHFSVLYPFNLCVFIYVYMCVCACVYALSYLRPSATIVSNMRNYDFMVINVVTQTSYSLETST